MPNSNYVLTLLINFFWAFYPMVAVLRREEGNTEFDSNRLPVLAVNDCDAKMINPNELLEENHKHLANEMVIYKLDYSISTEPSKVE